MSTTELSFEPADNARLANLCGNLDEHLRQVEHRLGIQIHNRGAHFHVTGEAGPVKVGAEVLDQLYAATAAETLTPEKVHLRLQASSLKDLEGGQREEADDEEVIIRTRRSIIRGRGPRQKQYLRNIQQADLNFGVGPAGTGKTYLAVCAAVQALERDEVRRLLLVRPAVEAGERLGFLPGDLAQKIDPYLRPLYDALYEMLGFEKVSRLIERNVIEVAPLAYMRGRTLNEAFIILDEAQNTTIEQMKMFLTRIGFGSTAVVTGDTTQIDLPKHVQSGLRHALKVLDGVSGVRVTHFSSSDVVRHPLVQRIVEAYDAFEARRGDS